VHPDRGADQIRESDQFGIESSLDRIDIKAVNAYTNGVVGKPYNGLSGLVTSVRSRYRSLGRRSK